MFARLYVMWTFLLNKQFEVMESRERSIEQRGEWKPSIRRVGERWLSPYIEWRSQAFLFFFF